MVRALGPGAHDHARLGLARARRHEQCAIPRPRPCTPGMRSWGHRVAVAQRRDLGTDRRGTPAGWSCPRATDTVSPSMLELDRVRRIDRDAAGTSCSLRTPRVGRWRIRWRSARSGRARRWTGVAHHPPSRGNSSRSLVTRSAGRRRAERLPPGAQCRRGTARTGRTTRRGRTRRCAQLKSIRSTESSSTITTPEPSWCRRHERPRSSAGSRGRRRPTNDRRRRRAGRPATCGRASRRPPASISSRKRGAELDLVHAGRATAPDTQNSLVPVDPSVPSAANAARRAARSAATLTNVSTLLTTRRLAEQADLDRERGLVARLAAEPLDRVEDRGLLAADVGAGARGTSRCRTRTRAR